MSSVNCEIKQQKLTKVLQISATTNMQELPKVLGEIFNSVIQHLQEKGEAPAGPAFAAYYNCDMNALQIDAGFIVDKDMPESDTIKMGAIPECKAASCIHVGSYSELPKLYEELMNWAKDQKLDMVGTGYEFYYNSPMNTPEEELKTEIIFPVK
jgi:effector-binding domain-containing protein